ncbi:MAG: Mth938-like domain-containing protein [Gammaproteobacteria bacterium]|nr:Mth938-like domain-containing protein [Gammaproteobacteria bacterium]MBU1646786.1 Mth938-like domain-containing protein [Gammaproteobacteria bacterium]MBU1971554.1 Mth938-like domain-containing protein [Gammaproteobacteria bacterium]
MKLQSDVSFAARPITAHGPGYVTVGGERLTRSFLLGPAGIDATWGPDSFDGLSTDHFAALAAVPCDIMLLGTGSRQRFPAPALLRPLIEAGRGIEVMDTAAAARTYSILVADGRSVAVALIVE